MWRMVLKSTLITVPVTVAVLDVFGYVARVEGASMQPALNPSTLKSPDYVFLNRWQVRNFRFQRGEVVSITSPNNPSQTLIKRIIAIEGDTVKALNCKVQHVTIPAGHCWIEGDHHGQSMDSNLFGPVALGLITAKASHIVWPPSRWQWIETVVFQDRLLVKEPSRPSVVHEEQTPQELEEMLLNDGSGNNCDSNEDIR